MSEPQTDSEKWKEHLENQDIDRRHEENKEQLARFVDRETAGREDQMTAARSITDEIIEEAESEKPVPNAAAKLAKV